MYYLNGNISDRYLIALLTNHRDSESIGILEHLLNAGANVNVKNTKGMTPLMIAVAKGHKKITKVLLKQPSIDPQQQVNRIV